MLGGDHTTTLSALRAAYGSWGKVAVVHFDAHIGMCPVPVMRGIGVKRGGIGLTEGRYVGSEGVGGRYFGLCVR